MAEPKALAATVAVRTPRLRGFLAWSGLGLPASGLDRARWFYWAFAAASCVVCVPAALAQPGLDADLKVAGLLSLFSLLAMRIMEFRLGRLLTTWTELPHAVLLAFAAIAAGPLAAGVGLFFTSCFFRAVYAPTRRTVWATLGSIALLALCASVSVEDWPRLFVGQAFGIVGATLLTRVLVATLTRQNEQVVSSERLLSAVFDSLDVSVIVAASNGAPGMMNRAARALHRDLGLPPEPMPWHGHVATFAGDGLTSLTPEQMPSAIAGRGNHIRDMDMVVGLDDGSRRHFAINASPFTDPDDATRAVVTLQDVTAQRKAQAELAHLAARDPLTGLANRSLLTHSLTDASARAGGLGTSGAVIMLDVDGFKRINDSFGHAFGDEVLQTVAARLQACADEGDLVARLGGDEFAVLVQDGARSLDVARRIMEALSSPVDLPRARVSVSASIGTAQLTPDQDAATALAAADLAMYAAKAGGPGRMKTFQASMREGLDERLSMEADLQRALEQDEFELHYQPYVNLETGSVTGAEALVRWRHPTRGLVQPLSFIPIVEDNGMIIPLGRWILRTACETAAAWQPEADSDLFSMSVNVSARQLEDPRMVGDVESALAHSGLAPRALTLEITESALVDESPVLVERLRALKDLGIKIAVDDFGTGYSSLSRLRTFPVDTIKIDRSFVQEIDQDTGNALVRAIIALARALDLDIVAEGVETEAQSHALAALGCRVAQGYYFGRPAPATVQEIAPSSVLVASPPGSDHA